MTSVEWVEAYVTLTAEDILAEDLYANSHAALKTKLQTNSLKKAIQGPQFHWDGTAYSEKQKTHEQRIRISGRFAYHYERPLIRWEHSPTTSPISLTGFTSITLRALTP